jgi:hypothetical protein
MFAISAMHFTSHSMSIISSLCVGCKSRNVQIIGIFIADKDDISPIAPISTIGASFGHEFVPAETQTPIASIASF